MSDKFRQRGVKSATASIYAQSMITRSVSIPMAAIGSNLDDIIHTNIVASYEGKCVVEGYIKTDSVKIVTYSSGLIKANNVIFNVVFRCEVCSPVAGMRIKCVARNITKAGIRAECVEASPSPIVAFIIRDHHNTLPQFQTVEEGDILDVRVLGQRFELNDLQISVIGELIVGKGI